MAKLKNVSADEITALQVAADELTHIMLGISSRIEKGYCDDVAEPIKVVRNINTVARSSTDLVGMLLLRSAMQDQQVEYAALLAKRTASK